MLNISKPAPTKEGLPKCPGVEGCRLPTDVIIKCSDGTSHGAHARNLEFHCDSFPLKCLDSDPDPNDLVEEINVDEDGDTIALLCKFVHRQKQPDVAKLEWPQFVKLAVAVEKYGVFAAMEVCKMTMSSSIESHPYDVHVYALTAKYDDLSNKALGLSLDSHPLECFIKANEAGLSDLRDKAALKTLDINVENVVTALKSCTNWTLVFTAWVRQRERLHRDRRTILDVPPTCSLKRSHTAKCEQWQPFHDAVRLEMSKAASTDYQTFKAAIEKHKLMLVACASCLKVVDTWKKNYETTLLPAFSAFIRASQ